MTPTRDEFISEILARRQKERLVKRKADRQEYTQYRKEIMNRTVQQRKAMRRTSL